MLTAACRFYFTAIFLLLPVFTFAQLDNSTPSVSDLTIYISNQWAEKPPVADSTVLIMPACGDEKLYGGFDEVNLFLESVLETLGPHTINFVPYELTASQLSFMSAAADENTINHDVENQWQRFSGADTILRLRVNRSDKETSYVLEQTGRIDANHFVTATDRAPTVGDLMRTALAAYSGESQLFDEERCADYPVLDQFIEKPKPFFISQGFHLMTSDKGEDSQKLGARLAGMGLWHSAIRRTGDTRTVVALLDQRDLSTVPYARAHMSLIRKNSADAFDAWADYLNSNPNHYRALLEFAQAETFVGHCSEMYLTNLQTILDLSPSSPLRDALYGQATVRAAWEYRGDSFGDVVNKDHWKYFHALSALGAQRLESARQRDGLVPLVASELLSVYASEGRMELALELLSEYDEQFPEDISPWIALMHFLRPRWSGSPFVGPQFLEQALEKKSRLREIRNFAVCLLRRRSADRATQV